MAVYSSWGLRAHTTADDRKLRCRASCEPLTTCQCCPAAERSYALSSVAPIHGPRHSFIVTST
eukprot:2501-Eustigmatos_ZCMA.PRE.1